MSNQKDLQGKGVVVTGSSRGIGAATAGPVCWPHAAPASS